MPGTIRVLSIDGGGIRGVIPAMVLAEMERRTRKPAAELFDLIAGTSTGGILALALTKPGSGGKPQYSAADLIGLYEQKGSTIFARSLWHTVVSADELRRPKYTEKGIETVLEQYFGEARFKDAVTPVMITSYNIETRAPYFFKSWRAVADATCDFPMRAVARATSAAPTYFPPAKLDVPDQTNYAALIDGGVFANNPTLCAYAEARILHREANDFLVVSLGTGQHTRSIPYDEAQNWGLVEWAQPLLSVVFDGVSSTVEYQINELVGASRYFRFQADLKMGSDDMDNATQSNIHALKVLAQQEIIEKSGSILATLCAQLDTPAIPPGAASGARP
ncbi:MAG TPA: CBASS cGAMP-activated phospholipase [Terriglobia bacterium]|nr:CBASS cGAMP-activated phospholipase [Terriglobia bacterium]